MTLVGEGNSGYDVDMDDCAYWADWHGSTMPILADGGFRTGGNYIPGTSIALPNQQLIGPGMQILAVNDGWISDPTIEAYLPD